MHLLVASHVPDNYVLLLFISLLLLAEPAGKARQRSSIAKEIW